MRRFLRVLLVVSGQLLGCAPQEESLRDHGSLKAIVSPGGQYAAAIAIRRSGPGAVGSSVTTVYLGRKYEGRPMEEGERVFEGLHACNVSLEWKSDTHLSLLYAGSTCNIGVFRNFWYDPSSIEQQEPVRIEVALERR